MLHDVDVDLYFDESYALSNEAVIHLSLLCGLHLAHLFLDLSHALLILRCDSVLSLFEKIRFLIEFSGLESGLLSFLYASEMVW